MRKRTYVKVIVAHDVDGAVHPLRIEWKDGRKFDVDRLLDVRRAAATRAGGQGMRYTVRILGHETYLFDDEGRWFVEERFSGDANP